VTRIRVEPSEDGPRLVAEIPVVEIPVELVDALGDDQPCRRGTQWTCREWPDCECMW
jgi:hypothetical protein